MKIKNRSTKLGELLVHSGITNELTIQKALRLQRDEGSRRNLGDILIDMRACTQDDIDYCLDKQHKLRNGGLDVLQHCSDTEDTVEKHVNEIEALSNGILNKSK